jgi:peptidoglycan hydrolase-like protein with peptidoglycan-binding domain
MQGDAVKAAQQRLADLKYDVGTVDGIFGPQTAMAVKAFQQHNGLNVDGIIGPRTWAALRAPGACPADAAEGMC